jgi:hypothetical protein
MAVQQKVRVTDGPYIEVRSQSNPDKRYRCYAVGTDKQWCTCPSRKFGNRRDAQGRGSCKHLDKLNAAGVTL